MADREARKADDDDLRLIAEGAEEGVVELGDEARRIGGQARRQSARESRTNKSEYTQAAGLSRAEFVLLVG